jgi:hypothetical protein
VENLIKSIREMVSRAEFLPVKMIAYGLAISVLSSVLVAVLSNVLVHR